MKTLVIAEHDNASLKAATLNAVAAANALGGDVDILVIKALANFITFCRHICFRNN